MPFSLPNNTNFTGLNTPWVVTNNDMFPGETVFNDVAKSFMPLEGNTPLRELFPDEEIYERVVMIEQSFESTGTIFPLAEWGKPDVVLGHDYGVTRRRMVQPLVIRRSAFMSHGEMNTRLRPGTINERWSPAEQIAKVLQGMVREHNLTWDVWRAHMLLGGISYTDPRSGVMADVPAQIPSHNLWSYNVTSGYQGRNEANIFRTYVDANTPAPAAAGVPWTDPDADLVGCVQRFGMWFRDTNKSKITAMYMSPEMRYILMFNNQVKLALGGLIYKTGAITGDRYLFQDGTGGGVVDTPDRTYAGAVGLGADGLVSIGGIPIYSVETTYKDPEDGVFKRIWPKNKVVFVSSVDPQGASEMVGRTQFCVSEESGGQPGLWTRTQDQTQIPAAPGMYIQMGNAGMPYLKYPYRVAHMQVSTVQDINNRLGVVGDLQFGQI